MVLPADLLQAGRKGKFLIFNGRQNCRPLSIFVFFGKTRHKKLDIYWIRGMMFKQLAAANCLK